MADRAKLKTIFAGDLPASMTTLPNIKTEFNVVRLFAIDAYLDAYKAPIRSAILTEKHFAESKHPPQHVEDRP